MNKTDIFRSL